MENISYEWITHRDFGLLIKLLMVVLICNFIINNNVYKMKVIWNVIC